MLRKRRHNYKDNLINYQNPRKSTKFSPSPIKRYKNNNHKSSLSQTPIAQLSTDDKENQHFNTILSQQLSTRRGRKPLQERKVNQNELREEALSNIKDKKIKQESVQKTSRLPLQVIADNSEKKQESQVRSKMKVKVSKEKFVENLEEDKSEIDGKDRETGNDQYMQKADEGVHQEDLIRNSRSLEPGETLQFKNLDNQSDSLMDATHNSGTSQGPLSMQYQGRWTSEEHEKFLEGLKLFGKDWRQIEEHIGSRSCAQIRSHAQKYFNKLHRDQAKALGTYQKARLGKRKREELKRAEPITISASKPLPNAIEDRTKQQVAQIHETLMKLAEDDMLINLRSLITQREQVCLEFIMKKITSEEACKRLISITNLFHQAAMRALQSSKFEICNRMVDERNLSQFICILLSKQITVLPDTSASNQEIIQHVHTMSLNSQDSLQTHLGGLIGTGGDTHDAIPSKLTSPKQEMIHSVKLEHDPHSAFHRVEKAHPDEEV